MTATKPKSNLKNLKKANRTEKPRKPKPIKVMSDELDRLQECKSLVERIEKAESLCDERAIMVEQARDECKNMKGAYSASVIELRRLCRARKEKHPLFDQSKKDNPADLTKETPKATDGLPEINYNQPSTAVTIELTEDCLDIDKQLVKGNTYHPWSVSRKGVELLLDGKEFFVAKSCFVFVEGRHLVEDALIEHEEGFNASTWQAWLRARPEAKRPTIVVTDGSALKSHATNEAWRDLPLSAAGINGHVGVLLAEAGHDTLGRLSKLMQEHGQWWPKEVKGIGEAGATEVADRFAEFWKEHPEYCAA